MIKELEKLSPSEAELLSKAPMLVCILIAGADNEIDNREIKGAIELAKKGKAKATMTEFYRNVSEDFEDKLKIILQGLPPKASERNLVITRELAELNPVFAKISKTFVIDYYKSLRYIAKKIAESSGGILGLKSVGEEEMKLISLPMLNDPTV